MFALFRMENRHSIQQFGAVGRLRYGVTARNRCTYIPAGRRIVGPAFRSAGASVPEGASIYFMNVRQVLAGRPASRGLKALRWILAGSSRCTHGTIRSSNRRWRRWFGYIMGRIPSRSSWRRTGRVRRRRGTGSRDQVVVGCLSSCRSSVQITAQQDLIDTRGQEF